MDQYITALDVSTNKDQEEELYKKEFNRINVNLNTGAKANKRVFLWYKKGNYPITRVQVTFNEEMEDGLKNQGYKKIEQSLNTGTDGKAIYMWYSYTKGSGDLGIVDVEVSTNADSEASHLTDKGQWEEVSCNLNLGNDGNIVYAWLKREKLFYISKVTATDSYGKDKKLLSEGFTRVDVNTNMGAVGGAQVFIWYLKTDDATKSLGDLAISTNDEIGFKKVDVNLNENTTGPALYLWYKENSQGKKVRNLELVQNDNAVQVYRSYDITVNGMSLNTGNNGAPLYLGFWRTSA